MAAASEGATVGIVASGWAASIIATLAETDKLFQHSPVVGFALIGILGGFAGWCLLIEMDKLEVSAQIYILTLLRRMALGLCIGIAGGIAWASYTTEHKGVWMLGTGLVACAPVEAFRMALVRIKMLWGAKKT